RTQRRDLRLTHHGALLEHEAGRADRMNDDRALGVGRRDGAELHAALSAFSGASRSRAVISPMIASAISGGDTAPIASPIGAWMRASASADTPWPLSRSTRRACVFREPSAPI